MTRVGSDISLARVGDLWGHGPALLDTLHAQGLEGINVRTLTDLSPTLDIGELEAFRQRADELDMYVEMGVGKINPYMTAELPEVRALGDGDFIAGMERMFAVCADMGWTTLWTACAGVKEYAAPYDTDRARREAPWPDQLRAIRTLVDKLLPALRHYDLALGIETHEEITTYELVRIVEDVDDPHIGICFDPANPIARGEDPRAALERIAPYLISTQLRDVHVLPSPDGEGLTRFLRPCGDGQLDWSEVLGTLLAARPGVNLTIEGVGGWSGRSDVPTGDPIWRSLHPDLSEDELTSLRALGAASMQAAADGREPSFADLDVFRPDMRAAHDDFVARSAAHLRSVLAVRAASVPTSIGAS
ncbi:sugar phosphate isomerase/epimerase [Microbacterium yannicii]|uniref:Sugar phosphate isomerase/epimerase n=1 Tax=Microbacterium yannicii TaxID=671622 RepID=A0ABP9MGX4_9MICO|nr:TIM barrel protein [Microbacterium yannicii]MCO5952955.1 sugar phosphate isomerase/epimerase [Microbacterium yannicii]